ncbi:MAG: cytochrome c [Prolixibacteraceae bacterium]|jgi:thiosulfate dehydrogenase|nr:cytochrome c [Prolixibacteraceae bacterium]
MKMIRLLFMFPLVVLFLSCAKDEVAGPSDPVAYTNAKASKGGMMFDKFWAPEAGYDQSSSKLATLNAKSDFFRCKQCHGWDLKGRAGSYIGRAPKTSRPNVAAVDLATYLKTKSAQELFDAMKKTAGRRSFSADLSGYNPTTPASMTEGDKMPNYNELMSDAQIWDVVKYLKEGALDVTLLYDATYSGIYPSGTVAFTNVGKDGNATNGDAHFNSKCAVCHGNDGKLIPNLDATTGMTVGKFIRTKPNELQHKIKFGQLGTSMAGDFTITATQMKDLYKAGTNVTKYPD